MGSSRINAVRQRLAEIPKRNFKGFLSDDIHTTDMGYADPDFAVKEHEGGQSYNQRIRDKRKIKPKKPLNREKKYKKVKGNEFGGEAMKDVMKGIPGSRVVGTADLPKSEIRFPSMEKASEVAFKSRQPADIKGYSKSYKKRELDKATKKYGEGSPGEKKVYDKLYKTDPFKDPKKAHPTLIEKGGYPEGGFAEPKTRSTIVDITMSEINRLAERGDIDEAKNLALQNIPNAQNMSEEQLDELLDHIVDTDITDWGDEGIMSVSRKNAERFSKLHSARIQMARERLGAVGKISNLNDKMISKARYKGKDFPHKTNSSAFLTPDGTFVGTNDHARTVINTDYKYNKFLTEKGGSLSRVTTQWLRDSGAYRLRGIYPDYNKRESLSGLHIQGYVEPTKQQIKQLTKLRDQVGSENVTWEGSDFTEKLGLDIKKPQERTHTEMMGAKLRQRIGVISPKYKNYRRNRKKPVAEERVIPKDELPANYKLGDKIKGVGHITDLQKKLHKRQMGGSDPDTGEEYQVDFHEEPMFMLQENAVGYAKLRQRIAGLGFRERILNWLKEQPRFKSFDPDSSFVGTVKYDQDNQSMQIELNGKKYDFCNVEERLFDSFSGAGSKGAFFNREIKSLHNCGAW